MNKKIPSQSPSLAISDSQDRVALLRLIPREPKRLSTRDLHIRLRRLDSGPSIYEHCPMANIVAGKGRRWRLAHSIYRPDKIAKLVLNHRLTRRTPHPGEHTSRMSY